MALLADGCGKDHIQWVENLKFQKERTLRDVYFQEMFKGTAINYFCQQG